MKPPIITQCIKKRPVWSTCSKSRPVLLSFGTTLTSEVVAGYIGYGWQENKQKKRKLLAVDSESKLI